METADLKRKRGRPRTKDREKPNPLSQFRESRGLTQKELADIVGVKQTTISNAENYGRSVGHDTWYKLAEYFQTDPRILEGKNNIPLAKK